MRENSLQCVVCSHSDELVVLFLWVSYTSVMIYYRLYVERAERIEEGRVTHLL